jgi:hypothetical protein
MFINALAGAIDAAHHNQFDDLSRQIWRALDAKHIPDHEAQALAERLQGRRSERSGVAQGTLFPLAGALTPAKGLIAPRVFSRTPEARSPNRWQSIERRRRLATSGPMPPALACRYTVGELAVLKVLADEWLAHGACDRSVNELAARAGVCRTLAKRALRLAELDGLITVHRRPRSGRKHLTNITRIVRAEWIAWLSKGSRKTYATTACHRAKPIFAEARGVRNEPPRSQGSARGFAKGAQSDHGGHRMAEASRYQTGPKAIEGALR